MDIGMPVEVVEVELSEIDAPHTEQPTDTPAEAEPQEVEVGA
jgi:hypothetical protein